jgi:hypothetical protein
MIHAMCALLQEISTESDDRQEARVQYATKAMLARLQAISVEKSPEKAEVKHPGFLMSMHVHFGLGNHMCHSLEENNLDLCGLHWISLQAAPGESADKHASADWAFQHE